MLSGCNRAIVVGNAQPELMQWAKAETLQACARQQVGDGDDGLAVWLARYCSLRHPTHFGPPILTHFEP
jgi:hypothetical protein